MYEFNVGIQAYMDQNWYMRSIAMHSLMELKRDFLWYIACAAQGLGPMA